MMRFFRIALILLLSASPAPASDQIIETAIKRFDTISSYSTTMRSYGGAEQVIRYRYKKPGYVRMDFIKPHQGAALVYRPDTGKVQLRPFGFLKPLILTMEPTAKMVRSPSGHRIDESDIGILLAKARELEQQGAVKTLREEFKFQSAMTVLEITGDEGVAVDKVHRYRLWMDKELGLPRVVESYDLKNQLIEGLLLEDLKLDPVLGPVFDL